MISSGGNAVNNRFWFFSGMLVLIVVGPSPE
jgi:hypothetical protein